MTAERKAQIEALPLEKLAQFHAAKAQYKLCTALATFIRIATVIAVLLFIMSLPYWLRALA